MTTPERLRHVLGELAAEAPIELRRSEQVWARHRRRRRTAAITATALVAIATVLLAVPSDTRRTGLVAVTPSPSPRPSNAVPAPSGAVRPGAAGAPDTSSRPATPPGAMPDGTPTARPTAPTADGAPVGLAVHAAPAHLNPGDQTIVDLHAFAWDNGLHHYTVDWGDGSPPATTRVGLCRREGDRYAVGGQMWSENHTYAAVGDYQVTVTAVFGGCGRPAQARVDTARVLVDDELVGVPGPLPGALEFWPADLRSAPAPGTVAVQVRLRDPDSYVAFVVVDWGDGTATVLRRRVPAWCAGTPSTLDPDWPAYVEHTYPRPGEYAASATVRWATCDGGPGVLQAQHQQLVAR